MRKEEADEEEGQEKDLSPCCQIRDSGVCPPIASLAVLAQRKLADDEQHDEERAVHDAEEAEE